MGTITSLGTSLKCLRFPLGLLCNTASYVGEQGKGFFKSLKKELQNSSLEGNLMAKGKSMGSLMETAAKWKGCQGLCLL